jgi:NADPH:quinone reductase-like Zn-dependent oxidoreductase
MSKQTVFRLPSKGAGYEKLEQVSEPIPKPQAHEVLLKIHATTLNYRDIVIADGGYPFPVKDNVVPLSDGAGTIEEVGAAVTGLTKGDWAIVNFDITNLYGPQQGTSRHAKAIQRWIDILTTIRLAPWPRRPHRRHTPPIHRRACHLRHPNPAHDQALLAPTRRSRMHRHNRLECPLRQPTP